jgi:RNA polymerase sigma-70 factor (ECF subfamily)
MMDFEEYIDRLKEKDEDAFEAVYQNTKHAVYAVILAVVRDRIAGEDLMQETYLTMLEKINQYQKGRNFRNWLLAIARNKAIDYYRKQKPILLSDPGEDDYLFPTENPKSENRLLMEEMLKALNEKERSIFLMKTIEGLKTKEIAQVMQMPLGTVLWHYRKAINKIKQL